MAELKLVLALAKNENIRSDELAKKWKSVAMPKFKDYFARAFGTSAIMILIILLMTRLIDEILKHIGYKTGDLAIKIGVASVPIILFVFAPVFAITNFLVLEIMPN